MIRLQVAHYDDGQARGYFPVVERQAMLEKHVWWTWVTGIWYAGDNANSGDFAPGRRLVLVTDPANRYDAKAVGIWNAKGSKRAGWIPRSFAERMTVADRVGASLLECIEDGRRTALFIAVSRVPMELVVAAEPISGRARSHLRQSLRRRPIHQPEAVDPVEAMRRMLSDGS